MVLEAQAINEQLIQHVQKWRQEQTSNVLAHQIEKKRVLGLDQATNLTGWSIFDDGQLIKSGVYKTSLCSSSFRIAEMEKWLMCIYQMWKPDTVILEDLHFNNGAKGVVVFKTLAKLLGVLENKCINEGIDYIICPVATWRSYSHVGGRARAEQKENAQRIVTDIYNLKVSQDEADAILIGRWGAEHDKSDIQNWEE